MAKQSKVDASGGASTKAKEYQAVKAAVPEISSWRAVEGGIFFRLYTKYFPLGGCPNQALALSGA